MSREAVKAAGIILGCCLWAAIPGCSFHRTEHGFILRSGQWSLERNRQPPDLAAKEASDKPELLPWRSRLKGYRLGSRIFHGRESAGEVLASSTDSDALEQSDIAPPRPEPQRPDLVAD